MTQREIQIQINNPNQLNEAAHRLSVAAIQGIRPDSTPEKVLSMLATPIRSDAPIFQIPVERTVGLDSVATAGVLNSTATILGLTESILGIDGPSINQSQALVHVLDQANIHEHLPAINASINFDDVLLLGRVSVKFPVLPGITPDVYPQRLLDRLKTMTDETSEILELSRHIASPVSILDEPADQNLLDSGRMRSFSFLIQPLR